MKIQDAINELKDSIKGEGYQCHPETYKIAIIGLEMWLRVLDEVNKFKDKLREDDPDMIKILYNSAVKGVTEFVSKIEKGGE